MSTGSEERRPRQGSRPLRWGARLGLEKGYYLGEILAKVGLVGAAAFAVWQFYESKQVRRVERAVSYIDTYEKGEVAEARRTINAALRPYARQFATLGEGGVSAADKREMVMVLIEDDASGKLADSLDRLVDFHDGLRLCTTERLCEPSVVQRYFCSGRARKLLDDFAPYFEDRKLNNSDFADGLQWCALGGK